LIFPNTVLWLGYGWILITLMAFGVLRVLAFLSRLKDRVGRRRPEAPIAAEPLPVVSIMVPLHGEDAILPSLIERLSASEYPVELLDICLVLEAGDTRTHAALARLNLPPWFRAITVPASPLRTKPRAMNYALGFCKGSFIGIYDAEDAPERDQIHRMVDLFAKTGPEVACIQGYLDFYNARRNWLARCFTIEYAIWFRVILHGIERLDLPVPLGGTTVFFRRTALESLGAWDAHNVTEDADLGFRLARLGYRCAFLATTTREEANCRLVPWIRQRSRWLKGYAMTWVTHMRNPAALWRDLGAWRFLAFQVLTLGTISNFVLAPVIWSLWLVSLGFNPAYTDLLPWSAWSLLGTSFVLSEIILFVIGVFAVSGRAHRHLIPWVVTMPIYWPLATLAAYKALFEVIVKPHYWDKTSHGHLSGGERPEKAAA
ncbi:MAG: glycosyltransferase family 2 protein, partial [Paracoccaceae bacterium]